MTFREQLISFLIQSRSDNQGDSSTGCFINALLAGVLPEGMDNPSCADYVDFYVKSNGIIVDGAVVYDNKSDPILDPPALFYQIFESYKIFCEHKGIRQKKFVEKNIASQFGLISESQWAEKKLKLRNILDMSPDKDYFYSKLDDLVYLLMGNRVSRDSVEFRLAKAFIAHWIWQVLIKVFYDAKMAHKFGHESMLVFYSPDQKTGKSTFCRWFLEPFNEAGFVWKTDFSRLEDKFSTGNLGLNYVAFFDEMARASSANMCRVKQLITEDEVHYRAMYSQREMKLPKTSTFLGTSNVSCRSLFNDNSGLRRFHEIQVNGRSDGNIGLESLEKWDFTKFYRSFPINVNKSPLLDMVTHLELTEYEESMRPRHVVELWKEDENVEFCSETSEDSKLVSRADLYGKFQLWASKHGYRTPYVPNSESFNKKLEELGATKGRTKSYRGFYIC